jgi:hypothetical protein
VTGATVEARHPEKLSFHEAIVNKIQDQSQYTVVFDDGDIATLRQVTTHIPVLFLNCRYVRKIGEN